MDDSEPRELGQPSGCPQFTAEHVFDRLTRWNEAYQADVLRLVQHVDWLRRIAPEWPPEKHHLLWVGALDRLRALRPAATELVELLALADDVAAVNTPTPRRPPSPRRLSRQAGGM